MEKPALLFIIFQHLPPQAPGVNRLPVALHWLGFGRWINTFCFFRKGKGCLQVLKQNGNVVFCQEHFMNNNKIMFKKLLKCPFQTKN